MYNTIEDIELASLLYAFSKNQSFEIIVEPDTIHLSVDLDGFADFAPTEKFIKTKNKIWFSKDNLFINNNFDIITTKTKSSNVRIIRYDTETQQLRIQFNDSSIYTYFLIPYNVFDDVVEGRASCKTTGTSIWGSWTKGKRPSVGAAVHRYLIEMGFPYRRG